MRKTLDRVKNMIRHEQLMGRRCCLIVGLGNPGRKYARNRHNVGFQCVDHLAQVCGTSFRRKRFKATMAEGNIGAHRVVLAKPLTFMNESGQAVGPLSRWYKIPPERILVIHDDLDLPLAQVRLRPGGSSGGHRGVSSIIRELGTQDFPRLRIGIGRPVHGDSIDYVLNDFGPDQEPVIRLTIERVEHILRCLLDEGLQTAMNTYNKRADS